MHSRLMTGSMPGMAASTSETWELGAPPNAVEAPENSLDCDVTWAWTSRPITTSQSPVTPLMSFVFFAGAFIFALSHFRTENRRTLFLKMLYRSRSYVQAPLISRATRPAAHLRCY